MEHSVSRASSPRGRFREKKAALRPPWALAEAAFVETCESCDRCRTACPEGIIVTGRGGLPEVHFGRGGCTFCKRCVEACPSGALADSGQAPWDLVAEIPTTCFSWQGVVCRLCEEACAPRAITFHPALGGYALPEVDEAACTGCGACIAVCPPGVVAMRSRRE